MAQYIDKAAIVAEIERIIDAENESINSFEQNKNTSEKQRYNARMALLEHILSFLDTIEVKENDLVEELDYDDYIRFFNEHPGYTNDSWGFDEAWKFAQYFFELGLKTQKGDEE